MAIPSTLNTRIFNGNVLVPFEFQTRLNDGAVYIDRTTSLGLPRQISIRQTVGIKRGLTVADRSLIQLFHRKVNAAGVASALTLNLTIDRDRSGLFTTADIIDTMSMLLSVPCQAGSTSPMADDEYLKDILLGMS